MKPYTSEEILNSEDLYELQDSFCCSGISFNYELTKNELQWLKFVNGRYSVSDWINENLQGNILTFNNDYEMSKALDNDCMHSGKAVCLSDDSALQKLFFWLYIETE